MYVYLIEDSDTIKHCDVGSKLYKFHTICISKSTPHNITSQYNSTW